MFSFYLKTIVFTVFCSISASIYAMEKTKPINHFDELFGKDEKKSDQTDQIMAQSRQLARDTHILLGRINGDNKFLFQSQTIQEIEKCFGQYDQLSRVCQTLRLDPKPLKVAAFNNLKQIHALKNRTHLAEQKRQHELIRTQSLELVTRTKFLLKAVYDNKKLARDEKFNQEINKCDSQLTHLAHSAFIYNFKSEIVTQAIVQMKQLRALTTKVIRQEKKYSGFKRARDYSYVVEKPKRRKKGK